MNKKKIVKNVIMVIAYFAVGIAAIIFAFKQHASDKEFLKKAKTVDAKVVDVVTTKVKKGVGKKDRYKYDVRYDVYVSYTIDGVEYNHIEIDTYESNAVVGNVINLHYDPQNPEDARDMDHLDDQVPTAAIVGIIFILIGAGVAIVTALKGLKKRR